VVCSPLLLSRVFPPFRLKTPLSESMLRVLSFLFDGATRIGVSAEIWVCTRMKGKHVFPPLCRKGKVRPFKGKGKTTGTWVDDRGTQVPRGGSPFPGRVWGQAFFPFEGLVFRFFLFPKKAHAVEEAAATPPFFRRRHLSGF